MKKILYILLAFCLLLTLAACGGNGGSNTNSGSGEGNGVKSKHVHCVCAGNSKGVGEHTTCSNKDGWVEIDTAMKLSEAVRDVTLTKPGYFVLTKDMEVAGYLDILEGTSVHICLNGHTLSATTRNLSKLTVTDCKGTGVYTSDKTYTIRGYAASTTNIFGGNFTITGSKVDSQTLIITGEADEALMIAEDDTYLNFYNGKIYRDPTKVSSKNGANLYMGKRAKVTMYNGVITGANAVVNGTGAVSKGGNVAMIGSGSTFTMYNGEISNGSIATETAGSGYGGNIGMWDGELRLLGGKVFGGKADGYGGNFSCNNTPDHIEFNKVAISGGKANKGYGGNCYFNPASNAGGKIIFSGATVSGGETNNIGGNLYFASGKDILIEDSTISDGVSPNGGGGVVFNYEENAVIVLKGKNVFKNNTFSDICVKRKGSNPDYFYPAISIAGMTGTDPVVVSAYRGECVFTTDANPNHTFVAAEGQTLTQEADGKLFIKRG